MMFTIRGIPTAGIAVGTAFVLQRRASAAATAAAGDPVAEACRLVDAFLADRPIAQQQDAQPLAGGSLEQSPK